MSTCVQSAVLSNPRLYYPLQHTYQYLTIKDLLTLASTCTKFYNDIETYCKEKSKRLGLKKIVYRLYRQQLKRELDFSLEFKRVDYNYKWLYVSWTKLRRIHRKSVTHTHLVNSYTVFDAKLKRNIIDLTNIRSLRFAHTFRKISPGKYRAGLRMRVDEQSWSHHDAPAFLHLHWTDRDGFHDRRTEVRVNEWGSLRECIDALKTTGCVQFNGGLLGNYDRCEGWFDFCLEEFSLRQVSDVTFEFKDVVNCSWKCGMQWDYVQLKPTDWQNN